MPWHKRSRPGGDCDPISEKGAPVRQLKGRLSLLRVSPAAATAGDRTAGEACCLAPYAGAGELERRGPERRNSHALVTGERQSNRTKPVGIQHRIAPAALRPGTTGLGPRHDPVTRPAGWAGRKACRRAGGPHESAITGAPPLPPPPPPRSRFSMCRDVLDMTQSHAFKFQAHHLFHFKLSFQVGLKISDSEQLDMFSEVLVEF